MAQTASTDAKKDVAPDADEPSVEKVQREADEQEAARASEVGGPEGPEPTRYGDWEKKGRCVDF